ncbi:Uncharacterised protein [BD1-7 clade bacterium]|uniref:VOC domain-containing protein n=1 Tax=BD1-7 clade bacterium TaxID=2029982 RepID=A0A5S9MP65_9GAMM|nr:Uncharacterised protein [BD1-7 clade bacterium]CAA0085057.1 Uncharacterised protein [BD1-7 clade bacterium]
MITIKRLDHIVLRSPAPQAMIRFYCSILGCTLEREVTDAGLYQLRAGDCLIDLVDVTGPLGQAGGDKPTATENNLDHFCLQVNGAELSDVRHWLEQQGINTGPVETRYGAQGFGDSIYLQDPDGNHLELRLDSKA